MNVALNDTIAAIATAPGRAGLALVRVSGGQALAIADRVFEGGAALAGVASHTLHHGWALEATISGRKRARIDEVVAAVFRAPRSYTREHVVELSCHGGRLPAARLLDALVRAGARLAGPGEFTLRAFLNGRVDLAQAEAVADLIHAETEKARELALGQLAGGLSRRLDHITDRLTDALAEVEARVDFADDVGGIEVPPHVVEAIAAVAEALEAMLSGAAYARAVREGLRVALVGKPNAGKSSLFNALLGEARAIVSDEPGTTRDRVSEAIELEGVRVLLSDTAGLRAQGEHVESLGMARTREAIDDAALVLWVVDGAAALTDEDRAVAQALVRKRVVLAINKRDLGSRVAPGDAEALLNGAPRVTVPVSARTGQGVAEIKQALLDLVRDRVPERSAGPSRRLRPDVADAVSNARHVAALERAREGLKRASIAAAEGSPGEIVALELREALHAIGEVTGKTVGEDLLDRIFSRFCIGK